MHQPRPRPYRKAGAVQYQPKRCVNASDFGVTLLAYTYLHIDQGVKSDKRADWCYDGRRRSWWWCTDPSNHTQLLSYHSDRVFPTVLKIGVSGITYRSCKNKVREAALKHQVLNKPVIRLVQIQLALPVSLRSPTDTRTLPDSILDSYPQALKKQWPQRPSPWSHQQACSTNKHYYTASRCQC
jgi:hypothetical protein